MKVSSSDESSIDLLGYGDPTSNEVNQRLRQDENSGAFMILLLALRPFQMTHDTKYDYY